MYTALNAENNAEKKMNAAAYLEQLIGSGAKIFIDTCSMLDDAFPLFMTHVISSLEKYHSKIVVPLAVSRELVHHMEHPKRPGLRNQAVRALKIVENYKDKYFLILGEKDDTFPDNPLWK